MIKTLALAGAAAAFVLGSIAVAQTTSQNPSASPNTGMNAQSTAPSTGTNDQSAAPSATDNGANASANAPAGGKAGERG
jgi:hypothetical protein